MSRNKQSGTRVQGGSRGRDESESKGDRRQLEILKENVEDQEICALVAMEEKNERLMEIREAQI